MAEDEKSKKKRENFRRYFPIVMKVFLAVIMVVAFSPILGKAYNLLVASENPLVVLIIDLCVLFSIALLIVTVAVIGVASFKAFFDAIRWAIKKYKIYNENDNNSKYENNQESNSDFLKKWVVSPSALPFFAIGGVLTYFFYVFLVSEWGLQADHRGSPESQSGTSKQEALFPFSPISRPLLDALGLDNLQNFGAVVTTLTLLTITGVGFWFTNKSRSNREEELQLTREANEDERRHRSTERLGEATKLLEGNTPQTMLAAHMLDDIINDNPKREHKRIVEFVCEWLREQFPIPDPIPDNEDQIKKTKTDREQRTKKIKALMDIVVAKERKESEVLDNLKKIYYWPNLRNINFASVPFGNELYLKEADLQGADLHGAILQGAKLQGANLHGAKLQGAKLQEANLQWADLHGAILHGAKLHKADLQEADLHGAILQEANLHGAKLQGANLHGANLQDANVSNADLRRAKSLTKEQIHTTKWEENHPPKLDDLLKPSE